MTMGANSIVLEHDHALSIDVCRRLLLDTEPWSTLGYDEKDMEGICTAALTGGVVAALRNGTVIGFAATSAAMLLGGYLRILVVDVAYRNQGIGRQLLGAFEQRTFARWPNAYLCVSDFNRPAREFYRHAGYLEVGELGGLLLPDHSEILMRKTLGPWRGYRSSSGAAGPSVSSENEC